MAKMAKRVVESKKTGEIFVFNDNWNTPSGLVKQLQYEIKPGAKVFKHFHPNTSQWFEVLSGELEVKVGGQKQTLKPGKRIQTKIGETHSQRNKSKKVTIVQEGYNPPIDIEPFFTYLPKALESKNLFKIFLFFHDHSHIVSSNTFTFRYIVPTFAWTAKKLGYGSWYKA